uniref:Uncharacterized protein n=1 Tax=Globisporangium ultimum (strain ATCC 200006 / CBS 805.95 / DAOM BR144) TaxID=431595 RepID=K3W5H4_GLOUD
MPVNRELPAGIASRRAESMSMVVKKPSGLNVARFIAREEELHQARKYVSANEGNSSRSRWEEKQNLRTGSGARMQQQKQLEEEMEFMNKEVQIVRHERLKKYYETCYE